MERKDLEHLKAGDEIAIKATVRNRRGDSTPFVDGYEEIYVIIDGDHTIISIDQIVSVPERSLAVGDRVKVIGNSMWTDCEIVGQDGDVCWVRTNTSPTFYANKLAKDLKRI